MTGQEAMPRVYKCVPRETYRSGDYSITTIRQQDMMSIKTWRNEQIAVLRQSRPLTEEDQNCYYRQAVLPSIDAEKPPMVLFSFLAGDRCIGYGGLTNIDWTSKRAEISFLLDTTLTCDIARYQQYFKTFLALIKEVAFESLHLNRLFTETYDIRPHHVAALEESGFVREGRLRQHVVIEGRFVDSLIHGCVRGYTNV